MKRALLTLVVLMSSHARAQPQPTPVPVPAPIPTPPTPEEAELELTPTQGAPIDPTTCSRLDTTPGALIHIRPTAANVLATPIPWSEFDIEGDLIEPKETVRALLEPTLQQLRTSLSTSTLPQVAQVAARFGYQLVFHRTQDLPTGTKLILRLGPLPLIKRVQVNANEKLTAKFLEDEIRRRMSVRVGVYLPWEPVRRKCAMFEERRRIEEFLYDEGYFDAKVTASIELDQRQADIIVDVDLKEHYQIGTVTIACPAGYERRRGVCVDPASNVPYRLAIPDPDIVEMFSEARKCVIGKWFICWGGSDFSRERYQESVQKLKDKFHERGYPGVRVVPSDPRASLDRREGVKTVNPVLTIDQRRSVQVDFVGFDYDSSDHITREALSKQLTFNEAGSADEVEIAASARALTTFFQTHGYFDARVTYVREPKDIEARPGTSDTGLHQDNVTFYIEPGVQRRVASVEFVGNRAVETFVDREDKKKRKKIEDLVSTKPYGLSSDILGTQRAPTSEELINDQERIKEAYRREGYADARVYPSASPTAAGLGDAAMTASLLALDPKTDLFVRFTIEEGPPTLLSRVVLQAEGAGAGKIDDELCNDALEELARVLKHPKLAKRTDADKCGVTVADLKYRTDDISATRDQLRDFLFKTGRARAGVELTVNPIGPQRVEARYSIKSSGKLRMGKVIIRGNFKTREWVIRDELDLHTGQLVTSDKLAEGARKLRNMGLFEAVNIDLPELDCGRDRQCNSDVVNAVVRVEERYVDMAEVTVEVGFSYVNGFFGRSTWAQRNILGRGIAFTAQGTLGTRLQDIDSRLKFPHWLVRPLPDFTTELLGAFRKQETARFGELITQEVGVSFSRTFTRERTEEQDGRTWGLSIDYRFRNRIRNVDALRPIGSDMDESQVAIQTRTGSIGGTIYYDKRLNRSGQLWPLAPEKGYYLEGSIAFADRALGGQDRFLKFSATASKFWAIGEHAVIRVDARYDQGYPFDDVELLPEVERFFAGGDSTVRGYDDDRLLTELIQVGVPPLDNVSQIRVIPAGGNIRVLSTVDGQVRIWKFLAGALFFDAGLITNKWQTVRDKIEYTDDGIPYDIPDIRPSVGMGLRALTPFGIAALEYAVPLRPELGDNPRGRIHFYFAARAQF